MDKEGVVNLYTMELNSILLSKISKTEIDNFPVVSHINAISETNQENKQNNIGTWFIVFYTYESPSYILI